MERKDFLKFCCCVCVGGSVVSALLESCTSTQIVMCTITEGGIAMPISAFCTSGGRYLEYVILNHEQLKYPICVYRFSDSDYTALHMLCTHQGAELQAMGDKLECAAHGSTFSNRGLVLNGPAAANLRRFPIRILSHELLINLSA